NSPFAPPQPVVDPPIFERREYSSREQNIRESRDADLVVSAIELVILQRGTLTLTEVLSIGIGSILGVGLGVRWLLVVTPVCGRLVGKELIDLANGRSKLRRPGIPGSELPLASGVGGENLVETKVIFGAAKFCYGRRKLDRPSIVDFGLIRNRTDRRD